MTSLHTLIHSGDGGFTVVWCSAQQCGEVEAIQPSEANIGPSTPSKAPTGWAPAYLYKPKNNGYEFVEQIHGVLCVNQAVQCCQEITNLHDNSTPLLQGEGGL